MSRCLIPFILLCVLVSAALGADVRLRSVHTATAGMPVRLSDVAEITGPDADRLADLVVIDDPAAAQGTGRWISVGPEDIRKAMRANDIATTRHTINGRRCIVRLASQITRPAPDPTRPEAQPETISLTGPQTVRTRIAHVLAHRYGVTNDNLRVLFDPGHESLLARELGGLSCIVRPVSSHLSDRLRIEIRLVRGERVVGEASVTGIAQIRRPVAVLVSRLNKGDTITRADLRADVRWLDPSAAAECATLEGAIGQRATNRLDPSALLRTKDVEAPLAVRRGDSVVVLTVAGGVSIETVARVLRDGVVGERVSCRLDRASEPFDAVVTGPGRVLVNLDAPSSGTRGAMGQHEGDRP
ncbi:MAG: hypothetical protein Tsb0013_01130 [Phycisphaerales bacterium]